MANESDAAAQAKAAEEKKKADEAAAAKAKADAEKKRKADEAKAAKAAAVSYFKSTISGLTVRKKDGGKVRFSAYFDTHKGDRVKVGYLATDDKEVVEILSKDPSVEKIEKAEHDKAVGKLDSVPVYSV